MILDAHTHIFPPVFAEERTRYLAADVTFAELYASPKATLATAEDLLRSMDEARIDASVALGFAWSDAATCRLHNDYVLDAAGAHPDRIIGFPNLPLAADDAILEAEARRCVAVGARGFGELRPDNLDFDITGPRGDLLAGLARELHVPLLFHVTEPAGHTYPGKRGLSLEAFYAFVSVHRDLKVIGAHWAGGLPFYAAMPEVRSLPNLFVDTAASSLLYDDSIYQRVVELAGAESILFGSDFPLLAQSRSRRRIEEAPGVEPAARDLILGANARALLLS